MQLKPSAMNPEEAARVAWSATRDDDGAFTLLRLGRDPGAERVHELRLALRVLWRHWKSHETLPFEVSTPAAVILHFHGEAERHLRENGGDAPRLDRALHELDDLSLGAFEVLLGRHMEGHNVRRPDLGE